MHHPETMTAVPDGWEDNLGPFHVHTIAKTHVGQASLGSSRLAKAHTYTDTHLLSEYQHNSHTFCCIDGHNLALHTGLSANRLTDTEEQSAGMKSIISSWLVLSFPLSLTVKVALSCVRNSAPKALAHLKKTDRTDYQ